MIKINQFELENVKRIKAVKVEPIQNGLTVIGGKNGQGKTSVLDSIAWALGGEKYHPSQAQRDGSVIPPMLHIELSNGLIVERKGKNSDLKITDPRGNKGGQQLLNEFISQLALDLPKFINSTAKEKANILLKIIGVGDKLAEYDHEESSLYNERHAIGQMADRKEKYAKELPCYPERPSELISISELVQRQQAILAQNGLNQKLRDNKDQLLHEKQAAEKELYDVKAKYERICKEYDIALKSTAELHDESTEQLEKDIAEIERINNEIRANLDREKAIEDAQNYRAEYSALTEKIDAVRKQRTELLNHADLPLDGLSVKDGELVYNGYQWDTIRKTTVKQLKRVLH